MIFKFKDPIQDGTIKEVADIDIYLIDVYNSYLRMYNEPPKWVVFKGVYKGNVKQVKIHYSHLGDYADDIELAVLNMIASDIPEGIGRLKVSITFTDNTGTKETGIHYPLKNL